MFNLLGNVNLAFLIDYALQAVAGGIICLAFKVLGDVLSPLWERHKEKVKDFAKMKKIRGIKIGRRNAMIKSRHELIGAGAVAAIYIGGSYYRSMETSDGARLSLSTRGTIKPGTRHPSIPAIRQKLWLIDILTTDAKSGNTDSHYYDTTLDKL